MDSPNRPKCHIKRGPFCTGNKRIADMSIEYLTAYIAYTELTHPSLMFAISDCVKSTFHYDYLEAKKALYELETSSNIYIYLALAICFTLGLAITLLFLYLKKGKHKQINIEETLTE